jgi:hypothetical protein
VADAIPTDYSAYALDLNEGADVRFRPARVVRVTSKEELDSALASADQVIVEGDDRLLSYAVTKAARDAPLSNVDIQMRGRLIYVAENAATGDSNITSSNCAERTEEPSPPSRPRSFSQPGAAAISACTGVRTKDVVLPPPLGPFHRSRLVGHSLVFCCAQSWSPCSSNNFRESIPCGPGNSWKFAISA